MQVLRERRAVGRGHLRDGRVWRPSAIVLRGKIRFRTEPMDHGKADERAEERRQRRRAQR